MIDPILAMRRLFIGKTHKRVFPLRPNSVQLYISVALIQPDKDLQMITQKSAQCRWSRKRREPGGYYATRYKD